MLQKLKKMIIYVLIFLVVVALGIYVFMQQAQFGQEPQGKRLERIQQSPYYKDGAFQNLSPTPALAEGVSYWDIIKAQFQTIPNKEPLQTIPSIKTDLKNLSNDSTQIIWFGHSSYLIHTNGKNILVDPVFSGNASPVSFFGKNYDGSNVYSVDDMPEIDILLITHDHYDHLDYPTVTALKSKVKKVVTSLGTGQHFEYWGFNPDNIIELEWWQNTQPLEGFEITSTPARHFSGRKFTRNLALWSSYVLKTPTEQLYLGGDSGYDSHFKQIGEKFGSFDLAILECGQYNYYWKYIHMMPEEVTQAAKDLNTKVLMPVHWSKFTLALHPWKEPIERVTKSAKELGLPFTNPRIGEPVIINGSLLQNPWWKDVE